MLSYFGPKGRFTQTWRLFGEPPRLIQNYTGVFISLFLSGFPSAIPVGEPAGSTRVLAYAAWQAAFEQFDYSMAEAIAFIMAATELAVIGAVLAWRQRLYRGGTAGQGW